jgi:cation-transporting ATPase 13A2
LPHPIFAYRFQVFLSIGYSLFYRRALLQEATHVAVFTPLEVDKTVDEDIGIQKRLLVLQQHFHSIMAFIFSEVHLDRQKGEVSYCRVQQDHGTRYFIFRLRRYSYDPTLSMFVPGQVQVGDTLGDFMALSKGLDPTEVIIRRQVVGYNTIQVRKPFLPMNIIKEFSKPFYTYQLFLVWAWYPFNFYYMATVQAFIIISGGLTVAFFLYRNERNLYRLSHVEGTVDRLSGGTFQTCSQRDLVPGDVVQLFAGPIYADMVLLQGTDVLVDESALTGESTPMAKTAIDMADAESMYSHNVHKRHSILAGTNVIEVGGKAVALVIKTGSYTAKGELLRDVLSFRRHKFKFDTQVKLVLLILLVYAIMSFVIAICLLKDYFSYKWFYGMYIVGTALPPLLPTVFTVSVGVSDDRLARKRIACSNSDGISSIFR